MTALALSFVAYLLIRALITILISRSLRGDAEMALVIPILVDMLAIAVFVTLAFTLDSPKCPEAHEWLETPIVRHNER